MEPQSSLPYSQAPDTCPYPEPTPSSPTTPSHFLKIHLNIILPSTSWSPQWSLSLRFTHQNPVHTSPLLNTCHMPRPSHSSRYIYIPAVLKLRKNIVSKVLAITLFKAVLWCVNLVTVDHFLLWEVFVCLSVCQLNVPFCRLPAGRVCSSQVSGLL